MAPVFSIAVLLYPGADVMDFSGPVEIFSTRPQPGEPEFKITTFAHNSPVKAGALVYVPHASFAEVESRLEEYDILVVPGAHPDMLKTFIPSEEGKQIAGLVRRFAGLKPRGETGYRVVQSVCTGALLLAASGILAGRTVTTHHIAYDALKQVADQAAGGESGVNVVRKRWVDAGITEAGVRIVNAGGVTSGIDASLWVVELLVGKERAALMAEVAEFERRGEEGWGV
ncbi:transcriptional regulator [Trematosphaeria pertusa]|uniref:Transcriptional regulator n=1 Tax=Trematosphaeria pertusa TaxID=390896 RepID=A0A6A6ILP4_9PLEO|nr:transcriptional regulator [Trematosphaeria pertusa]KAF2251326.1 transcriptional regulator [Trematosphaeria pertusa]